MKVYGCELTRGRGQIYDLLACAMERELGMESLPTMERTPKEKPFFPAHPDIHFNVSHSENLGLCALDETPVGVDIQLMTPRRTGFLDKICSPDQRIWLKERGDSMEAFALLWCLKESFVKQQGTGLTLPVSDICPPLPAGEEKLLERDGLYYRIYLGREWRGAACGLTPPPEEIIWLKDV